MTDDPESKAKSTGQTPDQAWNLWFGQSCVIGITACFDCKHYRIANRCDAFPDGMPDDIAFGFFDHSRVYPGQKNSIVFQQKRQILDRQYRLAQIWRVDHDKIEPLIRKHKRRNPNLSAFQKAAQLIWPKGEQP